MYIETFIKVKANQSVYIKGGSAPIGVFLFTKK